MPVTRFEVTLRRPLAGGTRFGDVGAYEEIVGSLHFALDPLHAANTRITDLDLAPRNASGRVELISDLSILAPVARGKGNRRVLLDVVNRGNRVALPRFNRATRPVFGPDSNPNPPIDVGDGFLMRHGYTVVSCGWQKDTPGYPGLIRLYGPDAVGPAGKPITGRIYAQLQAPERVDHFLLSDRAHQPCPAADLEEPHAMMTVRDQPDGEPIPISRDRWRFARVEAGKAVPDRDYVHLDGGFEKGRLYQVTYTTCGTRILGMGFAALRDCASWLKHGDEATGNPSHGAIDYALAYGQSQTGRLLRTYLYQDMNLDESGREALDGLIVNVAGGMRGEFNQRFGQASKDRNNVLAQLFPFSDTEQTDPETGDTAALLGRMSRRGGTTKVFFTNTSAEYWRGDASLLHTDPDGGRDVEHGANVRIYHFTGTEHGVGTWPPTNVQPNSGERARNMLSTINYEPLLRAVLINLDRWVTAGVEPPPSRHPRIDDGTATTPEKLTPVFEPIPGSHFPRYVARPRRQDFGLADEVEQTLTLPPRPGKSFGSLVSAVDSDGNEVAGVRLPEIAVPLAAHTGWNLRHPDIGGENQLLVFAGATLPFPKDRAQRKAWGDPRASIEERYASRDGYLRQVRQAADALVSLRYMLDQDVEPVVERAATMWDYFTR